VRWRGLKARYIVNPDKSAEPIAVARYPETIPDKKKAATKENIAASAVLWDQGIRRVMRLSTMMAKRINTSPTAAYRAEKSIAVPRSAALLNCSV